MMAEQKMQWQQVAPGGLKGKVVSAHGGSGVSFICLFQHSLVSLGWSNLPMDGV